MSNQKIEPLKPCPFCGGYAFVFVKEKADYPYRVQCGDEKCSCRTDNYTMPEGAIEAWNRRVTE